jgi:hypothetical protein
MFAWCLQRVEVALVTKQCATAAFQKFTNAKFFSPLGCSAEWRGTRDLHMIIVFRLLINVWLRWAAHFGFEGAASIPGRWKKDDKTRKYDRLFLEDKARVNPTVGQRQCWPASAGWKTSVQRWSKTRSSATRHQTPHPLWSVQPQVFSAWALHAC